VAIAAGAANHARVGPWAVRYATARHKLRQMPVLLMALLTEDRTRHHQQLFIVGTVGRMAIRAIVTNRRVLEQEGPALFRMAIVAGLIDAIRLEQRRRRAAMRIVAIRAADFAFQQGHMRTAPELGALRCVALDAGLVDRRTRLQSPRREIRHRIVAIAAAEIVRAGPGSDAA